MFILLGKKKRMSYTHKVFNFSLRLKFCHVCVRVSVDRRWGREVWQAAEADITGTARVNGLLQRQDEAAQTGRHRSFNKFLYSDYIRLT